MPQLKTFARAFPARVRVPRNPSSESEALHYRVVRIHDQESDVVSEGASSLVCIPDPWNLGLQSTHGFGGGVTQLEPVARALPPNPNRSWFLMHFDDLSGRWTGQYVLVAGERVVDADRDLDALVQRLSAQVAAAGFFIGFAGVEPAVVWPGAV